MAVSKLKFYAMSKKHLDLLIKKPIIFMSDVCFGTEKVLQDYINEGFVPQEFCDKANKRVLVGDETRYAPKGEV